jgi:hypothetical protein
MKNLKTNVSISLLTSLMLLLAILVIFTSCTAESIETTNQLQRSSSVSTQLIQPENELYNPYEVAQPNVVLCGQIFGASTNFTSAGAFVGVYYYITFTTPYFDGTTTWNKGIIILNDAQNTPLIQQYWSGTPGTMCGTITYLYN